MHRLNADVKTCGRHIIEFAPVSACTICSMLHALDRIVSELPTKRDWLDPDLERYAREIIRKARGE